MTTTLELKLPTPTPKQAEIEASKAKRKILVCGRRFGKTTYFARIACKRFARGQRVLEAAPVAKQTDAFWRKCKKFLKPLIDAGYVYKNDTDRVMRLPNGGEIRTQTAYDANTLRGDWADLLLLDEYSYMDPSAWTEVGVPMLLDSDGDAMFAFTPNRRNHAFLLYAEALADRSGDYAVFHGTSYDNPHLKPAALARLMRDMSSEDMVKQEILAEFLENQGAVFRNLDAALTAPYDEPDAHKGHTIVGGGDWGKLNDSTALSLMCCECKREVYLDRFNQIDYYFQIDRLETLHKKWNVKRWRVELNSMGQPVFEQIVRRGIPVVGFTTTLTSKKPLIEGFSLALERGELLLLPDEVGRVELQAYEVKHTETGSKYSAPEGMHDDTIIGRALAYQQMRETPAPDPKRQQKQREFSDARKVLFG